MRLTVQVDFDGPRLDSLRERLLRMHDAGQRLLPVHEYAADRIKSAIERKFVENSRSERNPFGRPSTFWNRMLSGTRAEASEESAGVAMPREVAQRYFGGTIRPQGGKQWLTIPARAEAYGVSARVFNDLRFEPRGPDRAVLVQREQQVVSFGRKRKDGSRRVTAGAELGGGVMYWLVRSVTQRGNRELLPDETELQAAAATGARVYFRETWDGEN